MTGDEKGKEKTGISLQNGFKATEEEYQLLLKAGSEMRLTFHNDRQHLWMLPDGAHMRAFKNGSTYMIYCDWSENLQKTQQLILDTLEMGKTPVKRAMEHSSLTYEEAARLLGCSRRALEEWAGGRRNPKQGQETLAGMIGALSILSDEGKKAYLDRQISMEELMPEYRKYEVRKKLRHTDLEEKFDRIWERVPIFCKQKLTDEELILLMKVIGPGNADASDPVKETEDASLQVPSQP